MLSYDEMSLYLFKQRIAKQKELGQFSTTNLKAARKGRGGEHEGDDKAPESAAASASVSSSSSSNHASSTEDHLAQQLTQLYQNAAVLAIKSSQHCPFANQQEPNTITVEDVQNCISRYAYTRGGGKFSHNVGRCLRLSQFGVYAGVYESMLPPHIVHAQYSAPP